MEARVIAISAIQVECPACGGLCRSARSDEMAAPLITIKQEMSPVTCVRCGGQYTLPENAFIVPGYEGEE